MSNTTKLTLLDSLLQEVMRGNPNSSNLSNMTKPIFLDCLLQEVTVEGNVCMYICLRVISLRNTIKEHFVNKDILISGQVSRVQQYTESDQSTGISCNLSLYFCTVTVHDYILAMYVQNKLECSTENVVTLKLWVQETSF